MSDIFPVFLTLETSTKDLKCLYLQLCNNFTDKNKIFGIKKYGRFL